MARQQYCTPADEARIDALCGRVSRTLNCKFEHMFDKVKKKQWRPINTVFFTGPDSNKRLVLWADCRCRINWTPAFKDLMTNLRTWSEFQSTQVKWPGKELYLIFGLPDGHGDVWLRYDESLDKLVTIKKKAGRTVNTRDKEDIETMVHIPLRLFKPVGTPCQIPYV